MITRIGMAPRRRELTPAEALEHWRIRHADAAAQIPGLRRYVQLHPVLVDGDLPLPYPGFDVGSFLDFDDATAMDEGFGSETYRDVVRSDEHGFIDRTGFSTLLASRTVRRELAEPVVLVTLWRLHPASTGAALHAELDERYAAAVAEEGRGHEQYRPVEHPRSGREVDAAEAVDVVGFADHEEALAWLSRGTGATLERELTPFVFGAARLIARPHRVV